MTRIQAEIWVRAFQLLLLLHSLVVVVGNEKLALSAFIGAGKGQCGWLAIISAKVANNYNGKLYTTR